MVHVVRKNINDAIKYLSDKIIFGFGCGIQGRRSGYYLSDWGLGEKTKAFIDNDVLKIGHQMEYLGCKYPIIGLSDAIKMIDEYEKYGKKCVILVASLSYNEIYRQLEETYLDRELYCMSMDEIAGEQFKVSDYDGIVKEYSEKKIPKIIHYVWFGGEKPDLIKRNIDNWHKICPDYEFKEWNEYNYDISKNVYMKEAYSQRGWGFVSDYVRLDVVYQMGGIYLDTDIELIKKPDDLLFQGCFGCCDCTFTLNLGGGFGAVPYHSMIKKLRDYYNDIHFIKEDGSLDITSCNSHQLILLSGMGYKNNDTLQNIGGMNIYPMIFQGANIHMREYKTSNKTYWIHYGNMSWFNNDIK